MYALEATSGVLLWTYTANDGGLSTISLTNGVVYFGSANASTSAGSTYALAATNGTLLRKYQTGAVLAVSNAVTVVDGVVYAGSADSYVYALNASNGALLWRYKTGDYIESSPIVVNGVVYIGSDDNYVYALNASNGALRWRYPSGGWSTPTVVNGVAYAGTSANIYALNASTGTVLWSYAGGTLNGIPPVVANSVVYVNGIEALSAASGTPLWEYPADGVYSVANGVVYSQYVLGLGNATYLALNASTGAVLWSYQDGGDGFEDTPTVADGAIYAGVIDPLDSNSVYAFAASAPVQLPAQGPTGTERYGGNPSELLYCYQCAGDPIDTYSGNFSHTFTDLSVSGRGIPLSFTRTYNAGAASQNGPLGYGWTDAYNWSLAVDGSTGNITISQENGSTVTFAPNGSGGYTAPSRVLATLVKNGDGSYTFTRIQDQTHYAFNPAGQLTKETDRNGYATTLAYDGSGQLTTVTDSAGRTLTFTYDGSGHILTVTDPIARGVAFTYDGSGNLASATDVAGGITSFTYDANHLLLTTTDPRGGVTTNVYDGSARVTSQTDPMGRKTTFSYTPADGNGNSSTTITDPNGNVTLDQYYNGLLMSETKGYGTSAAATWSYTYDPPSLGVASITDPNGNITSQTWDASGNLLTSTDPLSRTTTYTYDALNDVTSATDPNGVTTTYTYDAKGNLLSSSRPLVGTSQSQTTTYAYGDSAHPGDVTAMTDPNGHTTTYTYDANGDRASATDPVSDKTTSTYNGIGWLTAQVSPNGNVSGSNPSQHTTSYTYDSFGDVILVTDPLGAITASQYDANRNLIQQIDAAGNITSYTYDLDNELTQVTRPDTTALKYTYDGDGNQLTQVDGAGNTTSYTYDPLNRLTSLKDPLGRTTTYAYDPAGNRVSLTDPSGRVTSSTYDAANELIGIVYSDGVTPNVTYTYDAAGRRASMSDGTGITTYSYDSLNRLTASTNGAGAAVAYGYDVAGNLTSLTYPGSGGKTVTRTFDAANRLTAIADWQNGRSTFRYDADGNLIGEQLPGYVQGAFSYNHDDRLTAISYRYWPPLVVGAPHVLLAISYARDPQELLTSQQSRYTPQLDATYSYTALNQIQSASTTTTTGYAYDAADNLTQNGSATLSYDKADELTQMVQGSTTTQYSYDKQGSRIQAASAGPVTTSYTYDQANRLSAFASGSTTAQYAYNGDGLRMSKTVNGGAAEAFTWDTAEGLPLLLQDGTTTFVNGPDGLPLEQISGSGQSLVFLHDQLGSTRALVDGKGNLAATYNYDAYGTTTSHIGTASTPLQFAGQYTDTESGLIYLRARSYDPTTAQFLTRDPLVPLTKAPYGYASDDPLNLTDFSGRFPWSAISNITGIVAGGTGIVAAGCGILGLDAFATVVGAAAGAVLEGCAVVATGVSAAASYTKTQIDLNTGASTSTITQDYLGFFSSAGGFMSGVTDAEKAANGFQKFVLHGWDAVTSFMTESEWLSDSGAMRTLWHMPGESNLINGIYNLMYGSSGSQC